MKPGVKKQGKAGRNGHCPTCGVPIDVGLCCPTCRASGDYDRWFLSLPIAGEPIIPLAPRRVASQRGHE